MSTNHKQVHVSVGYMEEDIDEGIAPLIEQLWMAGISTDNSCEENQPGIIWIEFSTTRDAARFLNIVAQYEEEIETLYNRARHGWRPVDEKDMPLPLWEYDICPDDLALELDFDENGDVVEELHPRPPHFTFTVSIRFPKADYPLVLERMTQHNARAKERRERHAQSGPGRQDAVRSFPADAGRQQRDPEAGG
jgi:hypothetical protein